MDEHTKTGTALLETVLNAEDVTPTKKGSTPMTESFAVSTPAPIGSGFNQSDYDGHTIIVIAPALKQDVPTAHAPANAADALLVVSLNNGTETTAPRFWGNVLVPQLTGGGDIICGKLGHGEAQAGRSAPWRLFDPTPDEQAAATQWLTEATNNGRIYRDPHGTLELRTVPNAAPQPLQVAPPAAAANPAVPNNTAKF